MRERDLLPAAYFNILYDGLSGTVEWGACDSASTLTRWPFRCRNIRIPAYKVLDPNRRLVTLQRPPVGPLATLAEAAQDAPDVGLVIAPAAELLDQFAHASRGPHPAGIARCFRLAPERLLELLELDVIEPRTRWSDATMKRSSSWTQASSWCRN